MRSYSEIVKIVRAALEKRSARAQADYGCYSTASEWHMPINPVPSCKVEEKKNLVRKTNAEKKVYRPTTTPYVEIELQNRYEILNDQVEIENDYTPLVPRTYTRARRQVRAIKEKIIKKCKEYKKKPIVERTINLVLRFRLRYIISCYEKIRKGYDISKQQIFMYVNILKEICASKKKDEYLNIDELGEEVFEHEMDVKDVSPVEEEMPIVAGNAQMLVASGADSGGLNEDKFNTDVHNFRVLDYITKWNHVNNFEWNSTNNFNSLIFKIDVLRDLFDSMTETPFMIPFSSAQFFRGDLEFLFTINTNQFMKGQLLVASIYAPGVMVTSTTSDDHVYSLSQKPHVILNAGSCQEAILRVPFKYPFDSIVVNTLERFGKMTYVKLVARVLSNLASSQQVAISTTITVSVRVINPVFSGMIGPKMKVYRIKDLDHEMLKSALNIASKFLSPVNCDFPPAEAYRPTLVPLASSSMSIGTNSVDTSERLRLDGNSSVPIANQMGDFDWNYVSNVAGIIDKFPISASDKVGDIVYKKEVSPLSYKSNYAIGQDNKDKSNSYIVPPIGVLASMKGYFRGGLKYKFSVVASAFHACKLIVAFIPGPVKKMDKISLQLMRTAFHQQYDILTNKEFEFVVPYISNQVFYPRTTVPSLGGFTMEPYGHLYVQIMSSLFTTQAVSDSIDVIVYQSAGEGLEFSIPNYPALMPDYDIEDTHIPRFKYTQALSGYFPYYVGTWRNIITPKGNYVPILRYGDVTDHIVQFEPCHKYSVYVLKPNSYTKKSVVHLQMYVFNKVKEIVSTSIEEVVAIVPIFDGYYNYAIPFNNIALAEKFVQLCKAKNAWGDLSKLGTIYETDLDMLCYLSSQENATYSTEAGNLVWNFYSGYNSHRVDILHEGDVNPVIDSTVSNMSNMHFGENTMNLKNICRRMQLYAELDIKSIQKFLTTSVILPVSPWGLNLESSIDNITPCRSTIGLIASGYLFFKGSLRFKFVCDVSNCKVWVQHRFDDFSKNDDVFVINDVNAEYAGYGQGYASTIFDTNVNGIFSVEVPYYSPCNKIYCNPISNKVTDNYLKQFFGLGSLYIGSDKPCKISVFYALGDDAEFSDFVGFPPMLFSSDVNNAPLSRVLSNVSDFSEFDILEHEMGLGNVYTQAKTLVTEMSGAVAQGQDTMSHIDSTLSDLSGNVKQVISSIPKMCENVSKNVEDATSSFITCSNEIKPIIENTKVITNQVGDLAKAATDTCSTISSSVNNMQGVVDNATKQVMGVVDKLNGLGIFGKFGRILDNANSFVTFLMSSVTHCIIGGTKNLWKHLVVFIVSLMSILMELPSTIYNSLSTVIGKLYKYNEKTEVVERAAEQIPGQSSEEIPVVLSHEGFFDKKPEPVTKVEGNSEYEIFQEILGLLLGVIYTKSDIAEKKKSLKKTDQTFMNLSNYFFASLPKNIKCTETIIKFIKSFWELLVKLFNLIKIKFFPEKCVVDPLLSRFERIQHWVEEVTFLTHPDRWESIVTREAMVKRVDLAYHFGVELQFILVNLERDNALVGLRRVVDNYQNEITKLRNKCHREKQILGGDREPFFMYMWGGPGIGKSTVKDYLLTEMLKIANVKYDGNMIFTVPINSPYWTGALNQPVAYIDDFNLTTDASSTQMYQDIVALKSTNVFKPNQADLVDKGRPFCPEILYVNSNMEVPKIPDIVEVEAFMRRPDLFVQVRMSSRYRKAGITKISEIPIDQCRNVVSKMEHLEFGIGTYEGKYTSSTVINYIWYDYKNFFHYVIKSFIKFRANQLIMSENRFKLHVRTLNLAPDDEFLVRANRFLYGRNLGSNKDVVSEAVENFSKIEIVPDSEDKSITNIVEEITNLCLNDNDGYIEDDTVNICTFDPKYEPKSFECEEPIEIIKPKRIIYSKKDGKPRILTNEIVNKTEKDVLADYEAGVIKSLIFPDYGYPVRIVKDLGVDDGARIVYSQQEEGHNKKEEDVIDETIADVFTNVGTFEHEIANPTIIIKDFKESGVNATTDMIMATAISEVDLDKFTKLQFANFRDVFRLATRVRVLNSFVEGLFVEFTIPGDSYEDSFMKICYIEWSQVNENLMFEILDDLKPSLLPFYVDCNDRIPPRIRAIMTVNVARRRKFKNLFYDSISKVKELWTKVYEGTKGLLGKALDFLSSFSWIWPLLGVLLAGISSYVSYKSFKKDPIEYTACEVFRSKFCALTNKLICTDILDGNHESKANDVKSSKKTANQRRSLRRQEAVSQMYKNLPARAYDHEISMNVNEQLVERIGRNTFHFQVTNGDEELCYSRFFVPTGRIALFPRHYVEHMAYLYNNYDNIKCKVNRLNLNIEIDLEHLFDNYEQLEGSSLCTYVLPVQFPPQRDCKKLMCHSDNKISSMESVGMLISVGKEWVNAYYVPISIGNVLVNANNSMSEIKIAKAYKYPAHGAGMCGSILVSNDIIVGMHVAGGCGMGAAESVSENMLNIDSGLVLDSFPPQMENGMNLVCPGNYEPMGSVLDAYKSYNPLSSAYEPTLFREEIELDMAPSRLGIYEDSGEKISPLMEGVKHHLSDPKVFPAEMLEAASKHYATSLLVNCDPVRSEVGILDFKQACDGIPTNKYYKAIDRSTSVGWPYIRMGAEWNRKQALVGKAGDFQLKPEFEKILIEQIEKRKNSHMLPVVFDDKLKDEVLPLSKVEKKGGTRIISCCPIDYLIVSRMYLQDFVSAISSANFSTECAVGMNVLGSDWDDLMTNMVGFSEFGFDGDYSKFGPSLSTQVVEECGKIINSWYELHDKSWKPEDDVVRKCLISELMFAWHLASNKLYKTVSGAPSGSPITVVLNSMVNSIYMRMAYYSINRELTSFLKYVKLITYGDDVLVSVRNKRMFSFSLVQKFLAEFSIKFTPANKDGSAYDLVKLTECSFLKSGIGTRQFSNGLNVFVYKLSLDSIKKILCFYRKNNFVTLNESILTACDAALCYLFGHGEGEFNKYKKIMNRVLPKYYNLRPQLPSYKCVEEKFVNNMLSSDVLSVGVLDSVVGM